MACFLCCPCRPFRRAFSVEVFLAFVRTEDFTLVCFPCYGDPFSAVFAAEGTDHRRVCDCFVFRVFRFGVTLMLALTGGAAVFLGCLAGDKMGTALGTLPVILFFRLFLVMSRMDEASFRSYSSAFFRAESLPAVNRRVRLSALLAVPRFCGEFFQPFFFDFLPVLSRVVPLFAFGSAVFLCGGRGIKYSAAFGADPCFCIYGASFFPLSAFRCFQ